MRLPLTIYKSSVLATIIGFLGNAFIITSPIVMLSESFSEGLIPLSIGLLFAFVANRIGRMAEFRKWIKGLKKSGELDDISCSLETATRLYSANPCKRTLKYIKSKNKTAAQYIVSNQKNWGNTNKG